MQTLPEKPAKSDFLTMPFDQNKFIWSRLLCHRTLILFLCIQPLFVLTVKGWSSGTLVLGGLVSLVAISFLRPTAFDRLLVRNWQHHVFIVSFSFLFISIGITGLLRQDLHLAQLDSPARFLLAIPIFIAIRRSNTDVLTPLTITIAVGTLLTLASELIPSNRQSWDGSRMSSHFADPLSFGFISLAFAFLSLTSLWHNDPKSLWKIILKTLAFAAGIYMSVATQSRTGWLAVPLLIAYAIYSNREKLTFKQFSLLLFFFLLAPIAAYQSSETIHARVNQAINETIDYRLDGTAPDTSIGLRLTFLRIASDMVTEKPLLGFGDTQVNKPEVPSRVKSYASRFAIDFALSAGFHNEIATTAVQYGLISSLAVALCFAGPFAIYWTARKSESPFSRHAAALGIVFTTIYFISSLSTEVFGLKYTVSFYAMTTAILCGIATRDH